MKIIHTGDLHLEAGMSANYTKEQARQRRNELFLTFTHLVEYAHEEQVSVIVLAGDLFDTARITKRARKRVYDLIAFYPEIDFLYVRGNHDRDTDFGEEGDTPDNLKVFEQAWTCFSYDEVDIWGLELAEDNLHTLYDSLMLQPNRTNLVVLHGQEAQYAPKDDRELIHLDSLKNKGIDYLALGHVHQYRMEKLDGRGTYCYCGCLEGRGFDECGTKGFVLLDLEDHKVQATFHPFAKRELHEVAVDVTGCETTLEMAKQIQHVLDAKRIPAADLVRVVLTGELGIDAHKDTEYLCRKNEHRYYLFKIKDETGLALNPEDYRYDKSLKGEFVRMLSTENLDEHEREEILLTGIRALKGEEFDL